MLLQLTPSISLLLREGTDHRYASIHMCHISSMYECVAVYETTHRIFDFDRMDAATLKKIEDGYAHREEFAFKRQRRMEKQKLIEFRLNNEADKNFIEPPANTHFMEPYESRIYYMTDPDRFPGINTTLIKQENTDPRHITLFMRMELPWREPVHGVSVDFLSASNIKMVFETLESEEEIVSPKLMDVIDNPRALEELLKKGETFPENEPTMECLLECDSKVYEILIRYDVIIPSPNQKIDGGTALHYVIQHGNSTCVADIWLLMGLGVDPTITNDNDKTPADLLRQRHGPLLWIQCLEDPRPKQPTELIDALHNAPMLKILLDKGKTFDPLCSVMKLLLDSKNEVLKLLADSKVAIPNPNDLVSDFNGTALHAVVEMNRISSTTDLAYWLKFGVDPSIKDYNDNTVIDLLRDTEHPVSWIRFIQNFKM